MRATTQVTMAVSGVVEEHKWYHDRALVIIFVVAGIQASFVGIELAVALLTDSLSLLSDGLHNLGDVASLGLGGGALIFSKRAASATMTFGWRRAELVGGLINGVLIVGMQSVIALQAIDRFFEPSEVEANLAFFITTSLSLVVNIVGAMLLSAAGVGHGHSHGGDGGHGHSHGGHGHSHGGGDSSDEEEMFEKKKKEKKEGGGHGHSHGGGEEEGGGHGHSHGEKKEKKEKKEGGGHGHSHGDAADVEESKEGGGHGHSHGEKKEKKEKKEGGGHGHSHGGGEEEEGGGHGHSHGEKKEKKKEGGGHGHSHGANEKSALLGTAEPKKKELNENFRMMIIHLIGDAAGCIVVLITGLIIRFTDWKWKIYADAVGSLLISAIIFYASWDVIIEAAYVLLQRVPPGLSVEDLKRRVRQVEGVIGVHELHVWQLVDAAIVGSCHVKCRTGDDFTRIATHLKTISHTFGLHSFTIQPEFLPHEKGCDAGDSGSECVCKEDELDDNGEMCELSCAPDCKETEDLCCSPAPASPSGSKVSSPRAPAPAALASGGLYGSV